MSEENLEGQLEKVIDESLEDTTASFKERQQLKDRLLDLFEDLSEEEQKGMLDQVKEKEMSRRSFLKTLGVGAGVLGLASTGAGWSLIQPQSQGVSDIDADTVDGMNASSLSSISQSSSGTGSGTLYLNNGSLYLKSTVKNQTNNTTKGTIYNTINPNPSLGTTADVTKFTVKIHADHTDNTGGWRMYLTYGDGGTTSLGKPYTFTVSSMTTMSKSATYSSVKSWYAYGGSDTGDFYYTFYYTGITTDTTLTPITLT
ncbi:MAG: twin-arginine translocation signal domain-containing protein [Candidatus Nanohalobium sp.]